VAGAEAYLHVEFHLDPSNRLATIHQRHRQDRQDRSAVQWHRANRFTNGRHETVRRMLSDLFPGLPVCLYVSVTLVYCGQTTGWINIKLETEVGLGPGGPGHIVFVTWRPSPPSQKGGGGTAPSNFRPMSTAAKLLDGLRWHLVRT